MHGLGRGFCLGHQMRILPHKVLHPRLGVVVANLHNLVKLVEFQNPIVCHWRLKKEINVLLDLFLLSIPVDPSQALANVSHGRNLDRLDEGVPRVP